MFSKFDPSWIEDNENTITFGFAFRKLFDDHMHKKWKKEGTKNRYAGITCRIIGAIPDHNCKSLASYSVDDFENIISQLETEERSQGKVLPEDTRYRCMYVIRLVVAFGTQKHYCEDILWGTRFVLCNNITQKPAPNDQLARLSKSLSPAQENQISQLLLFGTEPLPDIHVPLGLAVMYCLGLRNSEACGLNFGSVQPMRGHPEITVIRVDHSVEQNSNVRREGGKTKNAYRLIPVPDELVRLIDKRRTLVQSYLHDHGILQDINDLPLVTLDSDYLTRCESKHLTTAGRALFKRIKFDELSLAYLDEALADATLSEVLGERSPTTYTLRRNFATHLDMLNLNEDEIQYIMGHDIFDYTKKRRDYANPDQLLKIAKKMAQRPLVNDIPNRKQIDCLPTNTYEIDTNTDYQITGPAHIKIVATTLEPDAQFSLHYKMRKGKVKLHRTLSVFSYNNSYSERVNLIPMYQRMFRSKARQTQQQTTPKSEPSVSDHTDSVSSRHDE